MNAARWIASLTAVAALALPATASAGELQLRDDAHVFASSDATKLKAAAGSLPFDVRVVTTTAYADQPSFSRYVGTLVGESDMVVVGLDPDHHHVQVHFGKGSHVPRTAWAGIERSGNDSFRQGAWEQGTETILRAASSSVTTEATAMPSASAPQTHGSFLGPLILILVIAGVIGVVVMFARSRATAQSGPYGQGPYAGGSPYGPTGPGPYYGPPGAPQGGGMGPLGGGLIGAGLGGLAGYELGKMAGEHEERERDIGVGGVEHDTTNDGGSYDAGGGGSSFDDVGGDTGGDVGGFDGGDSGGGGSEF